LIVKHKAKLKLFTSKNLTGTFWFFYVLAIEMKKGLIYLNSPFKYFSCIKETKTWRALFVLPSKAL